MVATLMTSGTVTKKPVANDRRSPAITARPRSVDEPPHHGGQGQAVVGEDVEAMRGEVAQQEADREIAHDARGEDADDEDGDEVGRQREVPQFEALLAEG